MSNARPEVLVIAGDGICNEDETAQAFYVAGFSPIIRHINDLISEHFSQDQLSEDYVVLAIPGGFSFGDHLGAGKVLALKIQYQLGWNLNAYAEAGGFVLGIGNGFQTLIQMNVFGKDLSITENESGRFVDEWVRLTPNGNRCVWFKGLGTLDLPIRHSSGRIRFNQIRKIEFLAKLERNFMNCLKYEQNPNGSEENIAGLSDITGRILGMMPHPESFIRYSAFPEWTLSASRSGAPGQGLSIFENVYQEVMRAQSAESR